MDAKELAGCVVMLGGIMGGYHARIRDHPDNPQAILEWLEKADEQLNALMDIANKALAEEPAAAALGMGKSNHT
jgi:hypothetical protein